MKLALTIAASFLAAPALAQAPAGMPAAMAAAQDAAPDPVRLAAARPVIDALWPLGTYRRIMQGTMSKMMDSMMGSMFAMPGATIANAADPSGKAAQAVGTRSLGDLAAERDPYFRERTRIMMDVMTTEMIPLMERIEPGIRDGLARSYARRFTVQQLGDMRAFFVTPSGRAYAEQAMTAFMDPDLMKSMMSFVPELIKAMPGIMAKVDAATAAAHIPPPPKPAAKP